jgi:hypothetical protein
VSISSVAYVRSSSQVVGSARLLLLIIASHISPMTGYAWPSVPTLARECRLSERTVYRLLRKLEASGELAIIRRPGRCNSYRVTVVSSYHPPAPDGSDGLPLPSMPDESTGKEDISPERLKTWLTPGSRIYQMLTTE